MKIINYNNKALAMTMMCEYDTLHGEPQAFKVIKDFAKS
jgi:hypothetical protein